MVSRRNFFSICTMMAVLFFMFQFFQLFKESGNAYDINEYAGEAVLSGAEQWEPYGDADAPKILFLGEESGELADVVSQWCLYTKRSLTVAESPEQLQEAAETDRAEMLLIDGALLQLPQQEDALLELMDRNVTTVFLRLPDAAALKKSQGMQRLLGIAKVQQLSVETEGLQIYSGFLLGGEAVYKTTEDMSEKQKKLQDMELTMPWYQLGAGTKVYMTGLLDEDETDRELFPPVIWRNSYRGTMVFAVSGEYMTQPAGLGLLDAICYEWQDYSLYPVINAENVTVAGFPGFADENGDRIMELYSRSPGTVQQDVMWPGLYALSEKNRRKLTFCLMAQYDYDDACEPVSDNVVFFLQQMKEIGGEAGQTFEYRGSGTLAEKLDRDRAFWEQNAETYQFSACYAGRELSGEEREALDKGSLENVRTVATGYQQGQGLVSYYNQAVTLQSVTGYADSYSYTQDLQRRSLETALGYYNLLLDLKPALWPESGEDQWENYFDEISSNINTYWSGQTGFDSVTLTESDGRVRNLLNLSYSQSREADTVTLKVEGVREAWFLLRTHGEAVAAVKGGESSMLEENVYLIHVTGSEAQIELEKEAGQTGFYFS
ncbi:MAG: DUF2194 domain-containing protein [Butyrivibrio sp.]|nr:DUF2194 domain-containing protein [Acetatifactor muris]MCM1559252.1 DUF2194 domain-containing protein [Butyrivibrio sp.]